MVAPLIPIAAGVGSFLLAKASGASNRNALIAGGIGALGGYGLAGGTFGGTIAGINAGAGIGATKAITGGLAAGALTSAAMAPKPEIPDLNDKTNPGFQGVDPEAYAMASQNLEGLGQRASYADAPSGEVVTPSVYDFSNQQMYTAREGGLAEIKRFKEGGVNYLPSKTDHDEKDYNNYVRAEGYIEDGSGDRKSVV